MSQCTYPHSWRRIPNFPVCPRHLAGIRCVVPNPTSKCICERHERLLDHRKAWVTEDGDFVITAEPYRVAGEGFWGFIVDCEDLGLAVEITGGSPIGARYAKEAVDKGMDLSLDQGLRLEADLNVILQSTSDRAEGIKSFLEKRTPKFTGH